MENSGVIEYKTTTKKNEIEKGISALVQNIHNRRMVSCSGTVAE